MFAYIQFLLLRLNNTLVFWTCVIIVGTKSNRLFCVDVKSLQKLFFFCNEFWDFRVSPILE